MVQGFFRASDIVDDSRHHAARRFRSSGQKTFQSFEGFFSAEVLAYFSGK